jgi:hypothetical protein
MRTRVRLWKLFGVRAVCTTKKGTDQRRFTELSGILRSLPDLGAFIAARSLKSHIIYRGISRGLLFHILRGSHLSETEPAVLPGSRPAPHAKPLAGLPIGAIIQVVDGAAGKIAPLFTHPEHCFNRIHDQCLRILQTISLHRFRIRQKFLHIDDRGAALAVIITA